MWPTGELGELRGAFASFQVPVLNCHSQGTLFCLPFIIFTKLSKFKLIRVMMLGGAGVGKSSLCSQFLSSEHANTYERVEDSVEKEVIVAVNDKQSRIVFIDHQHGEMSLENLVTNQCCLKLYKYDPIIFQLATYQPHAFLIVLAVDDLSSLDTVSGNWWLYQSDFHPPIPHQRFFDQADYLLASLESTGSLSGRAAILVANKTDLVRFAQDFIL